MKAKDKAKLELWLESVEEKTWDVEQQMPYLAESSTKELRAFATNLIDWHKQLKQLVRQLERQGEVGLSWRAEALAGKLAKCYVLTEEAHKSQGGWSMFFPSLPD